jgi:hypothetical protein
VVPPQSESTTHWTQAPALHTWPVGHGCDAEQPCAHVSLLAQTVPGLQSVDARHATQVEVFTSHLGDGAEHVESSTQATHAP